MKQVVTLTMACCVFFLALSCSEDDDSPAGNAVVVTSPAAPESLSVAPGDDQELVLHWHDVADNEDYYYVERSMGDDNSFQQITQLGADVEDYKDQNLLTGLPCSYRVRAGNLKGFSDYSSTVSATPTGEITSPQVFINYGSLTTNSRDVVLFIQADNVTQMRLSNEDAFAESEWEPFVMIRNWTLDTGSGLKQVFLQVISTDGDTLDPVEDSIIPEMPVVDFVINGGAGETDSREVSLSLQVTGAVTEMYIENIDSVETAQKKPTDDTMISSAQSKELDEDEEWEPFVPFAEWVLSSGEGTKTVKVHVRNDFLIATSATASIEPAAPVVQMTINNGADSTDERRVTLSLQSSGEPREMQVRNIPDPITSTSDKGRQSKAQHPGAGSDDLDELDEWQPYASQLDWMLLAGLSVKKVAVTIRNSFGLEATDSVTICPMPSVIQLFEPEEGQYVTTPQVTLRIIAAYTDSVQVSNDASFTDAVWRDYRGDIENWPLDVDTLSQTATVFARCKNSFQAISGTSETTVIVANNVQDSFELTMLSDTVYVNINPGQPAAPEYPDQTELQVSIESWNGEPYPGNLPVHFLIDHYPGMDDATTRSPSINGIDDTNNPYHAPYTFVETYQGTCTATFSAGSVGGMARVRAWVHTDPETCDDSVLVTRHISILNGIPESLSLSVGMEGVHAGGSLWSLEVSALALDAAGSPAREGTLVTFSIEPAIASITESAYVGNSSPFEGISTPGVAFATLTFPSEATNDSVNIRADITLDDGGAVTRTLESIRLPLQQPAVQLNADPQNFTFWDDMTEPAFDVQLSLTDGHGVAINGQEVRFYTNTGVYYRTSNALPFYAGNSALTGPVDLYAPYHDADAPGVAQRYLIVTFYEAFPDPRITASEVLVQARVIGFDSLFIQPITISLTHQVYD